MPSFVVSVRRRAADPTLVVIVLEGSRDDGLADTSARRERFQSDAARPLSVTVENGRRGCGVRASIFDTSGDGTRGVCRSKSRKANDEADADVDGMDAVERVVDAMDTLRSRRGVAPGYGGVAVAVLNEADGSGRIAARSTGGRAAGGAGKALGLRSASGEPETVEPSAVWYGPSETSVPAAELGVGEMPGDGEGRCRRRRCRRRAQAELAVQPAVGQFGGRRAVVVLMREHGRWRAGRGGRRGAGERGTGQGRSR
jgi:hypothetical protein